MATTPAHGWPYLDNNDAADLAAATLGLAEKGDNLEERLQLVLSPPKMHAYRGSATQNVTSGGGFTLMEFGTELGADPYDMHSTTVNPSRVYARASGIYAVEAGVTYPAASPGGGARLLEVRIDSAGSISTGTSVHRDTQTPDNLLAKLRAGSHTGIALNDGQYVEAFTWQNSGQTLAIPAGAYNAYLALRYLGPQ